MLRSIRFWAAFSLFLTVFFAYLAEGLSDLTWLRIYQRYLVWRSQNTLQEASQLLSRYKGDRTAWQQKTQFLYLQYERGGRLRWWNTARWPLPTYAPTLSNEMPEVIADEQKAYYIYKQPKDSLIEVLAVPLWIAGSSFLDKAPYILGGEWLALKAACISPSLSSTGLPLFYKDPSGQTFLRLYLSCPEAWRKPLRQLYGVLAILTVGLWLGIATKQLRQRLPKRSYTSVLGGLFLLAWFLSHSSGIPARFFDVDFFRAESVAFGYLIQNAWDLLVLGLILLWFLYTIRPLERVPDGFRVALYWGLWAGIGFFLWALGRYSEFRLEPSSFQDVEVYLLWPFVLAVIFRGLELIGLEALGYRWWVVGLALVGGGLSYGLGMPLWGAMGLVVLLLSYFSCHNWLPLLKVLLRSFLVVLVLDGWVSLAHHQRALTEGAAYARIRSFGRDLLAEARLYYRLQQIAQDSLLWKALNIEDNLIDAKFAAQIVRKYFLDLGEDYEIGISFWNAEDNRLDNQYELRPAAWRQLRAWERQLTLFPSVYLVSRAEKPIYYTSRVTIQQGDLRLTLQVDLAARSRALSALLGQRDEPMLDLAYAIYLARRRIWHKGHSNFPYYWHGQVTAPLMWRQHKDHYQITYAASPHQLVVLEYPRRTALAELASLPILLLMAGLVHLVALLLAGYQPQQLFLEARKRLSIQMRLLFLSLAVLPLLALVGVTFFLFFHLTQDNLKYELLRRLTTVQGYFREEVILKEKLAYGQDSYIPEEESYVRDLMRRVARLTDSEVSLYTAGGRLYSSTLSPAYLGYYLEPLLEPAVLQATDQGEVMLIRPALVTGYTPLRTEKGQVIGIIQVTFSAPPRQLQEPLEGFLAYGINVYLILILATTVGGLTLIERLLRGLSHVQAQLLKPAAGAIPPRLSWPEREDEIGTFVSAYNAMVDRLEISQKQLETTLRQVSQQEIARQAAHEIKNALTPIKLIAQHFKRLQTVEPQQLHRLSGEMLQKIETLSRIANRFLTFADSREETILLSPIHLNHFLEEYFQPYLQHPTIQTSLILPETPVWILGHADSLTQILNNLLQNAFQALEGQAEGRVYLRLEGRGQEAWIVVEDNGPGIPPEVQARIFEFYFTTKRTGTGLGLAITKQLVAQMRGRITVETAPGRGTAFYVVFPAHMA